LDDVPTHCRDGGIFRPGHSQVLDELCESFATIRQWIKALEPQLREQLQIKSLKVGFNKVFGYYIEIPNTHKDKVPDHFIRKQTLTSAERYITTTLKEKETILLNAQQEQANLEKRLYEELIQTVETYVPQLQEFASIIAHLDAIQSLASVAIKHNFTCPTIHDRASSDLLIQGLWHPMVAEHQFAPFIRNDVALPKEHPFMLITGPNMAGKSTVMRSVALCVIMGQMGGYVPAEMAHFRIVESLYTRIGASDKLAEGQSTFMVEMVETATICQNANQHSLILLDEIGRGTSTFDGVSIAAAVSEYLVSNIQARTLFATHYHELTALSEKYPQIQNASMKINDDGESLVFAYKLTSGAAEKSYGVMVAKMAGLPLEVTQKAQRWLDKFEKDAATGEIVQLALF
jgi:DNA mismatch repair protein MutS